MAVQRTLRGCPEEVLMAQATRPSKASNPCQPIRDSIAAIEEEILSLQDLLDEVPPSMKPIIKASIEREKRHLQQMRAALRACVQAHRGAG
jgi:hypothetical protein